jgi:Tfp pilus assembly protein PilO
VKTETLVSTLTGLTTTMAIAAPVVVFGFLYVMRVQPERAAVDRLRAELSTVRNEVNRLQESDARSPERDSSSDLRNALTALLSGADVGGVSQLSIATHAQADPTSRLAHPFPAPVVQTVVTVTFDAQYEQIGRFFSNLRTIPTAFDIQSVEVVPLTASSSGPVRAKVRLLAFEGTKGSGPVTTANPHGRSQLGGH